MPPGQLRHPSEDDFQKGRPRAGSNDTQQTYGTYDQDDRDSVVTQQEPLLPASHPRKWPKRKKALVLLVVSGCSFIVALSQAIYLPSIAIIQESFQTTRQLVLYSLVFHSFSFFLFPFPFPFPLFFLFSFFFFLFSFFFFLFFFFPNQQKIQ